MKLVFDTNAYSDWLRRGRWSNVVATADEIILPSIVIGELREGHLRGNRFDWNEKSLSEIIDLPNVSLANVGVEESWHYARFRNFLRDAGTPIPTNDIWIAAICFERSATLLTADRHFEHLPQVSVLWPEG